MVQYNYFITSVIPMKVYNSGTKYTSLDLSPSIIKDLFFFINISWQNTLLKHISTNLNVGKW